MFLRIDANRQSKNECHLCHPSGDESFNLCKAAASQITNEFWELCPLELSHAKKEESIIQH